MYNKIKTAIFTIIPLLGLLLIIEIICRLFFPAQITIQNEWVYTPFYSWTVAKKTFFYRKAKKQNDFKIILCLGDSCTYGIGVKHQEAYPYLLQQKLDQYKKDRYLVINGGVPGYCLIQSIFLYFAKFSNMNPFLVTHFSNHEENKHYFYLSKRTIFFYEFLAKTNNFLCRFKSYYYGSYLIHLFLQKSNMLSHLSSKGNVNNIEYCLDLSRIKNFTFLPMTTPVPFFKGQENVKWYNHRLRRLANQLNFNYIDMYKIFENKKEQDLFVDECHPNPVGHTIIADELFKIIIAEETAG